MHLIELFLPVADNQGQSLPESLFSQVRRELTAKFGGLTSFARAPAHGVDTDGGRAIHDDLIVMEVMTDTIEPPGGRSTEEISRVASGKTKS